MNDPNKPQHKVVHRERKQLRREKKKSNFDVEGFFEPGNTVRGLASILDNFYGPSLDNIVPQHWLWHS